LIFTAHHPTQSIDLQSGVLVIGADAGITVFHQGRELKRLKFTPNFAT
jgi:hypothetical protein